MLIFGIGVMYGAFSPTTTIKFIVFMIASGLSFYGFVYFEFIEDYRGIVFDDKNNNPMKDAMLHSVFIVALFACIVFGSI